MYSSVGIFYLIISVISGYEDCHDDIWQNETALSKCCNTIYDNELDDIEMTRLAEKCDDFVDGDDCDLIKCLLREEGVIEDENIDPKGLANFIMKGKSTDVWRNVAMNAVNICMEKMVEKEHEYTFLMDCLDIYMFVNCPKSEWTENETCAGYNKSLAACV